MFILRTKSDLQKLKVGTILFFLRPMIPDRTLRYHNSDTICTFGWSIYKIRNHLGPREDSNVLLAKGEDDNLCNGSFRHNLHSMFLFLVICSRQNLLITRAGRHRVLKCRRFVFICRRRRRRRRCRTF